MSPNRLTPLSQQNAPQPVVTEPGMALEPGEAVELLAVGIGDRREVAAEQRPVADVCQTWQQVVGVGRLGSKKPVKTMVVSRRVLSWASASARNSAYSGAPMCAITAVSRGWRAAAARGGAGR